MKKSKSLVTKHKISKDIKEESKLKVPYSKTQSKRSKSLLDKVTADVTEEDSNLVPGSKYLTKEIIDLFPESKNFIIGQWLKIEKMRFEANPAVDTMGVSMCGDKALSDEEYQYQTLVSLVVSASTNDKITFPAIGRLQKFGLTIAKIHETDEEVIDEILKDINYHRNKSKYIKGLTEMIINDFGGRPPSNIKDVMKLPGIGPKMGNLYMQVCFNQNTGIAVDTHVHRIANKLKWVNDCKNPEKTMKELESWLPQKLWDSVNNLLVGFGQSLCKAVKPLCSDCLLNKECEFGILYLESGSKMKKSKKKSKTQDQFSETEDEKPKKKSKRKKVSLVLED